MKKDTYTKGRRILPYFLFFILLLSTVSATWNQYQRFDDNSGFESVESGIFTELNTVSERSEGDSYQPTCSDYDNDSVTECMISDGNFINFYTATDKVLILEAQKNLGGVQLAQHFSGDIDSDGIDEIVISSGTLTYTINYNGSHINTTLNASIIPTAFGISCSQFSGQWGCYFGTDTNVTEYNPNTGGYFGYNITPLTQSNSVYPLTSYTAAIADGDIDSVKELYFFTDIDGDGKVEVTSWSQSSTEVEWTSAEVGGNLAKGRGLLVYNVDGGGTLEVCYTVTNTVTNTNSYLGCLDSDGSDSGEINYVQSDSAISAPAMVDASSASVLELCVMETKDSTGATSDYRKIHCYDVSDGTLDATDETLTFTETGIEVQSYIESALKSANMNSGSDNYDDFIILNEIFLNDGTTISAPLVLSPTQPLSRVVPVDLNSDSNLDIFGSYTSNSFAAFSDATNNPPTLTDSFGVSFSSPVCLNTLLRFSAREYDESETQLSSTNYYNDIDLDSERLITQCGDSLANYTNGSYSLSTPYVDCNMSSAGVYYITIYLQDSYNTDDYTQSDTFTIQVIDGTAGITCNTETVPVGEVPLTPPSASPIEIGGGVSDNIEEVIQLFSGGSTNAKMLIGFIALVFLMVAGFVTTGSGLASALIGFVWIIIATVFTLFPIYILILILLAIAVLGLIGFAMGRGA